MNETQLSVDYNKMKNLFLLVESLYTVYQQRENCTIKLVDATAENESIIQWTLKSIVDMEIALLKELDQYPPSEIKCFFQETYDVLTREELAIANAAYAMRKDRDIPIEAFYGTYDHKLAVRAHIFKLISCSQNQLENVEPAQAAQGLYGRGYRDCSAGIKE